MTYYINNDIARKEIIDNAYDLAINNYTWAHMAKQLINEVEKIQCPSKS